MQRVGISKAIGTIHSGIKKDTNHREIGPILLAIDNALAVRRNSEVMYKDRMVKEKEPLKCIIRARAWKESSRNHRCLRLPFLGLLLWRSVPLCR